MVYPSPERAGANPGAGINRAGASQTESIFSAIPGFSRDSRAIRLLLPTDGHVGEIPPNPEVKVSTTMLYSSESSRAGLISGGRVAAGSSLSTSTSQCCELAENFSLQQQQLQGTGQTR